VTRDVPPRTIVAGNPARILRTLELINDRLEKKPMKVPFLDLIAPHQEMEEELVQVFRESLRTAALSLVAPQGTSLRKRTMLSSARRILRVAQQWPPDALRLP